MLPKADFLLNEFTLKFTVQTTWFSYNFFVSTVIDRKNGTAFKNQRKNDKLLVQNGKITILANFECPNYKS